jgi:hypothetical protein
MPRLFGWLPTSMADAQKDLYGNFWCGFFADASADSARHPQHSCQRVFSTA